MNIQKPTDYNTTLSALIAASLSQMELYCEIGSSSVSGWRRVPLLPPQNFSVRHIPISRASPPETSAGRGSFTGPIKMIQMY